MLTNKEYQQRRDAILNELAMAAMWYGFDKAMDTPGTHTSATPDGLMAEAKQAIDNLFREEVTMPNKVQHTKEYEANRFEVINHLPDGSGREIVVWKGESFKVEVDFQDGGNTIKVFLSDKIKSEE